MKNKEFLERVKSYLKQGIFQACEFALISDDKSEEYFLSSSGSAKGSLAVSTEPEKLTTGMRWDLASVSKVVGVGTVLIDRILSGEIDLDTAFVNYYPAWHESTVTLRQLMTHTSGIDPFIKNREQLDFGGLVARMNRLTVSSDKAFHYTDVNFILLGLMLEELDGRSLDQIFQSEIFERWKMTATGFGPVENAVATVKNRPVGIVHDPKARVLGIHCGSAGLFSNLSDLTRFVQGYFADEKYLQLLSNFIKTGNKPRSLGWDLLPDGYLLHTGYTGTFILMNLHSKTAVVFLSNRVYYRDERQKWIVDRDLLIGDFLKFFQDGFRACD